MRDRDVRTALHRHLAALHEGEQGTLVVDELSLCGSARVDVSVINGHLAGYELKSASDTLRRLPNQVDIYGRVLDQAWLVVAERHVEHAIAVVPRWWGVLVARGGADDAVELTKEREAAMNPEVDPASLVTLLWRSEALEILAHHELDHGLRSKSRSQLWRVLAAELPLDRIRDAVRDALRSREGWRAAL